jgi:hypothetical protein
MLGEALNDAESAVLIGVIYVPEYVALIAEPVALNIIEFAA